jgi:hypothetical protein
MMDVRTKVTRRLLALLVGAASLTASPALAQEGDAPPPPAAPPVVVDDPGARLFGAADLSIDFHGFVNVEYDARGKELTPVPTFDVHNFFLASQVRIGGDVTLYGELEYEHGAIVRADRVFIDWTLHPALTLRAGRFDAPLSYERTHYFAPVRLLSSRPLQVDIAFHEWSDTGLQAYGRVGLFSYALALVNGPLALTESGIQLTDVVDNNRDKAFIGRLNATPLAGLELGAAWAQGRYDDTGTKAFRIFEADLRYRRGPLEVWSEYDQRWGDDEGCAYDPAGTTPSCSPRFTGDHARKAGFYVLAAYTVLERAPLVNYLKPVLRYDWVTDQETRGATRRATVGLNWSPRPHFLLRGELQQRWKVGPDGLGGSGVMAAAIADF